MSEWIDCRDKLPDPYKSVFVTFSHTQYGNRSKKIIESVGIGFYTGSKWSNVVGSIQSYREVTVLAWMPLPEKWEGEDGKE